MAIECIVERTSSTGVHYRVYKNEVSPTETSYWQENDNPDIVDDLEFWENWQLFSQLDHAARDIRKVRNLLQFFRLKYSPEEIKRNYALNHGNYEKRKSFPDFEKSLRDLHREIGHFNKFISGQCGLFDDILSVNHDTDN